MKAAGALSAVVAGLYALPSAAAETKSTGLPQLDVSLYPAELFWLLLCFGLLYVLMAYVALPVVGRTLATRQQTIAKELATAAAANDQAKLVVARYEKALADARVQAQETLAAIQAEAARQAVEQQSAQHKQLTDRLHKAEFSIMATRDKAVDEVKATAAELAQAIVARLTSAKA